MQELKGNIRVFCRVRPLLPDDGAAEGAVVSYPTLMESLGRGIDLIQSGINICVLPFFVIQFLFDIKCSNLNHFYLTVNRAKVSFHI